tara:strand:+ start:489 stop:839 length:351 start_codon:yes stop_codon:yes gene_type:complete
MAEEEVIVDEEFDDDGPDDIPIKEPELSIQEVMKDYDKQKKLYNTHPYLTKYEKTKLLAERSQQLSSGSPAFVDVPESITNTYEIALLELRQKKIPFIIKRPYGNGFEFWKVSDLS